MEISGSILKVPFQNREDCKSHVCSKLYQCLVGHDNLKILKKILNDAKYFVN
jgi:hypothetical protein